MKNLTVHELKRQLDAGGLTLLDVRGADELAVAQIAGAVHIPLHELAQRITELDSLAPIAVLCHHGMRSAMAAHHLESRGFMNVANVSGGIDAWSTEIDPQVPRY